jgi:nucleoside 2-deoxyribosyltransferase
MGHLSVDGWQRVEDLKRAHISSRFAFFARKFDNPVLDKMFDECFRPAVAETEFELRIASQKAGNIDAIVEDEIRRCRFLIADLSDDNLGAYWEAGFAEGLGKPVIYLCAEKGAEGENKVTHFDTNHRHTVRWDPNAMEQTAKMLKAVIRNTLLGDAKQEDQFKCPPRPAFPRARRSSAHGLKEAVAKRVHPWVDAVKARFDLVGLRQNDRHRLGVT